MTTATLPPYADSAFAKNHSRSARVAKYAYSDYRHTLEDSLRDILDSDAHVSSSYGWTNLRLALGYLSAVIGFGAAAYSHKVGFAETKSIVAVACVAYFVLSGLATLISTRFEGRHLVVATADPVTLLGTDRATDVKSKNGDKIQLTVTTDAREATGFEWEVLVEATWGQRRATAKGSHSIGRYFTESGALVGEHLYADVSGLLELLAKQLASE
ncbi:signal peptidase complex subunit 2 [Blastocladiella britannica]|nr:signal peptidase complex subunit 2 [Blastocladiella britannica]